MLSFRHPEARAPLGASREGRRHRSRACATASLSMRWLSLCPLPSVGEGSSAVQQHGPGEGEGSPPHPTAYVEHLALPSPTEGRGHNNNRPNLCDAVRLARDRLIKCPSRLQPTWGGRSSFEGRARARPPQDDGIWIVLTRTLEQHLEAVPATKPARCLRGIFRIVGCDE